MYPSPPLHARRDTRLHCTQELVRHHLKTVVAAPAPADHSAVVVKDAPPSSTHARASGSQPETREFAS